MSEGASALENGALEPPRLAKTTSSGSLTMDEDVIYHSNGHSKTDSVRIFHPDEAISKSPASPLLAPNPLKSSFRNGSSPSGSQTLTIKADEKTPKDSGGRSLQPNKSGSPVPSHGTPPSRGSHQRFPSTGLSYSSNPSALSDPRTPPIEKRTSSTPFSSSQRTAAANGPPGSPSGSDAKSHAQSQGKGHRRQLSTGRSERSVNFCPYDGYCFVLDETRCAVCGEERGSLPAQDSMPERPWKKVLYEKTGMEDNYTDRNTFLAELKKNVNVQEYSYQLVMADSLVVTQQIAIVVIFTSVFMHTLNGNISGNELGLIDIVAAAGGYLIWAICQPSGIASTSQFNRLWSFASLLKLVGYSLGLYVITPVLAALTDPISDDTITVLSIILLIIHLSFQDYGYLNPEQLRPRTFSSHVSNGSNTSPSSPSSASHGATLQRRGSSSEAPTFGASGAASHALYQAPVSLNAAIFASLLLASRLGSDSHAFVIIAFAVELFALFPIMVHHLKCRSWWGSTLLVVALVAIAVALVKPLSSLVTNFYVCSLVFTTFVSPFCLQWIQRYKNEIHGPWDEAVPARARRHGTRN